MFGPSLIPIRIRVSRISAEKMCGDWKEAKRFLVHGLNPIVNDANDDPDAD